ncbi:CHAPERONE DNAJ-DOMAIN SUPERFAMILY PROTEIN [Salix purpurea]|uniref:CHAPERONE DNAJ-DOMAIN SUPERFAMILY PROTEIN n=1 Tax=Salix purpurea TaxID=77065 RepID=A0A9Q0UTB6_SALPP|nr:CHAPERONE DNAJ-DOMAIN SUPERFAMILY PROTEIN [Salix purpurea]
MGGGKINQRMDNPRPSSSNMPPPPAYQEKSQDTKLWGVVIFGLIGATATTYAVRQLRRTADELYAQLTRSQSTWKGGSGTSKSFRTYFQEEAWINYNRRMQEAYEEDMERVVSFCHERIRRMQSVFNRERNKFKRDYERWRENGPGAYHQHFQRDDWYWKTDSSFRDQRTNFRRTPRDSGSYPLSHHYSVLGLDRSRTEPYTEAEIKTAFRTKAKKFHPDQNQNNKGWLLFLKAAEAKFKEVMISYEAIKQERKNSEY